MAKKRKLRQNLAPPTSHPNRDEVESFFNLESLISSKQRKCKDTKRKALRQIAQTQQQKKDGIQNFSLMFSFRINLREASSLPLDQSPSIFQFHTVVDKKVVEQTQTTKGKDISNPQCFEMCHSTHSLAKMLSWGVAIFRRLEFLKWFSEPSLILSK
ncbi:hypothetical protein CMV_006006 [Castanea mollissima]|uniref:Uncharacterized protein n=2 Tax=Castanea mollissima TaxID=60419 RepID=A0A8J4VTU0_9ROSI|nr:hypothetical protein CMV_006006 [Castanea mollissima]